MKEAQLIINEDSVTIKFSGVTMRNVEDVIAQVKILANSGYNIRLINNK